MHNYTDARVYLVPSYEIGFNKSRKFELTTGSTLQNNLYLDLQVLGQA